MMGRCRQAVLNQPRVLLRVEEVEQLLLRLRHLQAHRRLRVRGELPCTQCDVAEEVHGCRCIALHVRRIREMARSSAGDAISARCGGRRPEISREIRSGGDQGEIRARSGRDQGEIRGRSISPGSSATAASQRCLRVESGESSTLGQPEARF